MWESWPNSDFVKKQSHIKNRLYIYFDILFWYIFYGHDFNDYCTFEFWHKSNSEKKSYVSLRRNDVLACKFSSSVVRKKFLDKAAFNDMYRKYVHRVWLDTRDRNWQEIECFVKNNSPVIAKPLEDYGGHGIFKIDTANEDYISALNRLKSAVGGGQILYTRRDTREQRRY